MPRGIESKAERAARGELLAGDLHSWLKARLAELRDKELAGLLRLKVSVPYREISARTAGVHRA